MVISDPQKKLDTLIQKKSFLQWLELKIFNLFFFFFFLFWMNTQNFTWENKALIIKLWLFSELKILELHFKNTSGFCCLDMSGPNESAASLQDLQPDI